MWRNECKYLKSQISELNQIIYRMIQEQKRPPATVTVWIDDGHEYMDLDSVHTYQRIGVGRYAFYNNKGWILAEIGNVKDIYFEYPEEEQDECCLCEG